MYSFSYNTVQYSTVQCSAVQYSTVQYSTVYIKNSGVLSYWTPTIVVGELRDPYKRPQIRAFGRPQNAHKLQIILGGSIGVFLGGVGLLFLLQEIVSLIFLHPPALRSYPPTPRPRFKQVYKMYKYTVKIVNNFNYFYDNIFLHLKHSVA